MKHIALIADIHGNLPALMAVEADLRLRKPDEIWCLGDMIGKGPSSVEAMDWTLAHCSVILRGNWEDGIGHRYFSKNDAFYYRQLGEKRMKLLLELPLEHHAHLSGHHMRLLHGRPVMPMLLSPNEDAEQLMDLFEPDFDMVAYADRHRAGLNALDKGRTLFTLGSVGNSLGGLPLAQYAMLRTEPGEEAAPFDLSFIYLPYDTERAARDAQSTEDLPKCDAYIQEVTTGIYGRWMPLSGAK